MLLLVVILLRLGGITRRAAPLLRLAVSGGRVEHGGPIGAFHLVRGAERGGALEVGRRLLVALRNFKWTFQLFKFPLKIFLF